MIHWQTGKPPQGVECIVAYLIVGCGDMPERIAFADCKDGVWWCDGFARRDWTVIRWSTLDAAPDVVGKLERVTKQDRNRLVVIEADGDGFRVTKFDADAEAPTLAAAIEKLCGGTDGV